MNTLQTTYRSKTGAEGIGITPGFIYSSGVNVQEVLRDLDRAIQMRQVNIDDIGGDIDTHAGANIESAHSGKLPISRIVEDIATQTELDAEIRTRGDADAAHASFGTGVHGVVGAENAIVGTASTQTLTNKTLGAGTTINSNVTVGDGITIDGVDISGITGAEVTQAELDAHTGATSVHGVSGDIVGTTSEQTLTNKTLAGGTILEDITVSPGIKVDEVNISTHNHSGVGLSGMGASLRNGAIYLGGNIVSDNYTFTVSSGFSEGNCEVITSPANIGSTEGIDALCTRACRDGNTYTVRCWIDGNQEGGTGCPIRDDCTLTPTGTTQGFACSQVQYLIICVR